MTIAPADPRVLESWPTELAALPFGSPEFLADWATPPTAVLNFLGMTAAQAQARWLSNQNQWIEDKTSVLAEQLRAGTLDAALLALEADLGDVAYQTIARDDFLLEVPR